MTTRRGYEMGQFDWKPDSYLELIRSEVPRYDELQEQAIAAIPFPPERVLELGMGTGETTRRLIEAYPDAWVIGLDSSADMVFRAREIYDDVQLARIEDPLPDGPLGPGDRRPLDPPPARRAEAEPLPPGPRAGALLRDRRRRQGRHPGRPDRPRLRLPGDGGGPGRAGAGERSPGKPTTWRSSAPCTRADNPLPSRDRWPSRRREPPAPAATSGAPSTRPASRT